MRIATGCMECSKERDALGQGEVLYAELEEDQVLMTTCSKGHQVRFVLQQTRFELLLEMGGMAFLDGYYREAVSSFAAALERFFEFYILVVCEARQVERDKVEGAWKLMSNQSERQLGAFIVLHLLESGTPPGLDQKMTELRNKVVHKGMFPSKSEAYSYGRWAFDFIVRVGVQMRAKHEGAAQRIIARLMSTAFMKAQADSKPIGTQYTSMFLSWADASWASSSFDQSMKNLAERRHYTWASPVSESVVGHGQA